MCRRELSIKWGSADSDLLGFTVLNAIVPSNLYGMKSPLILQEA